MAEEVQTSLTKIRIDSFPVQNKKFNQIYPEQSDGKINSGNTESVLNINIHQPMMSVNLNAYSRPER